MREIDQTKVNNLYDEAGDKSGRGKENVYQHCQKVASYAVVLANLYNDKNIGANLDIDLIFMGAMVHDIGWLAAPIERQNSVRHGEEGDNWLLELGIEEKVARFCLCHVGSGFSQNEASQKGLDPNLNHLPLTLEEMVVTYADKFFSKNGKTHTIEEIDEEMKGYGEESYTRWLELKKLFGGLEI